ncbi:hypothetical protein ACSBR2_039256 [Camellia fascicularis]
MCKFYKKNYFTYGEVFGALHPTAVRDIYTDYAILLEDELTAKPVSISHVEASAIPFVALTAWRALKSTARITQGQRMLVVSGGGAVNFATIQLAVATEYQVSTICGSESIDWAMAAGAEQAVDYTTQDIESALKGQFDAVLNTTGALETERTGINLLRRGGHYMTLQIWAGYKAPPYCFCYFAEEIDSIPIFSQNRLKYISNKEGLKASSIALTALAEYTDGF